MSLPIALAHTARKADFASSSNNRYWWGFFIAKLLYGPSAVVNKSCFIEYKADVIWLRAYSFGRLNRRKMMSPNSKLCNKTFIKIIFNRRQSEKYWPRKI